MKERRILFSAPMVRAILAGTKTQTRRALRDQNPVDLGAGMHGAHLRRKPMFDKVAQCVVGHSMVPVLCPYGQPGDRLWVRETFQPLFAGGFDQYTVDWQTGKGYAVRYVATDGRTEWVDGDDNITDRCKPAIHMPRWASRITLEITGVRVERLQAISEADAMAEGVEPVVIGDGWRRYCDAEMELAGVHPCETPQASYRSLWTHINGPGSWDANPWVWCVSFRRVNAG